MDETFIPDKEVENATVKRFRPMKTRAKKISTVKNLQKYLKLIFS